MRKVISFICILYVLISMYSIDTYASANARFSMRADENIEVGKSFNVYLSAVSNIDIGVFRVSVLFDSEKLQFESAKISNDHQDEYMKYNVVENEITIIYMNSTSCESKTLNDIIKLKFSQKNNNSDFYKFDSTLYEIGDKNAKVIRCDEMPEISVCILEKVNISDVDDEDIQSMVVSELDSAEVSKEAIEKVSKSESLSENKKVDEYSLLKDDTNIVFRQNDFFVYILIGLIVIIVAVTAFKMGAKSGNKNK